MSISAQGMGAAVHVLVKLLLCFEDAAFSGVGMGLRMKAFLILGTSWGRGLGSGRARKMRKEGSAGRRMNTLYVRCGVHIRLFATFIELAFSSFSFLFSCLSLLITS